MRAMLNAMGATLWGAIAITLAVAGVLLSHRVAPNFTQPPYAEREPAQADTGAEQPNPGRVTQAARPPAAMALRRHGQTAAHPDADRNYDFAEAQAESTIAVAPAPDEPELIGHYLEPRHSAPQVISRVIGKQMTAAQKALQTHQWAEALRNLEAAEQQSGLTVFDEKTIHNFKGFVDIKLQRLADAQTEYDRALATGDASAEETLQMTKTLLAISASTQQFQKTVDYGKSLASVGAAGKDDLLLIAQSYYLLKDCKDSSIWADKAIAAARKSGTAPKENLFLFKLQCASDAADMPAMAAVLMDLIRLNNKTTYWNTLLRIERQDERDDHNTLMIYRIMYNTHSMNSDTDYIEMAQLLSDAALPAEAIAVLNMALSNGIIKSEHMDRCTRLLENYQRQADSDDQNLQAEIAEANRSATGQLLVELGEVYFGFGEYPEAIDAITRGLQKGSVRHMDSALVYLGLAKLQLQRYAEAKGSFRDIAAVSNVSPRLSRLWQLYAETLPLTR